MIWLVLAGKRIEDLNLLHNLRGQFSAQTIKAGWSMKKFKDVTDNARASGGQAATSISLFE